MFETNHQAMVKIVEIEQRFPAGRPTTAGPENRGARVQFSPLIGFEWEKIQTKASFVFTPGSVESVGNKQGLLSFTGFTLLWTGKIGLASAW
jgi:hypothetical protein